MRNMERERDGTLMLPSARAPAAPAEGVGICNQHARTAPQWGDVLCWSMSLSCFLEQCQWLLTEVIAVPAIRE